MDEHVSNERAPISWPKLPFVQKAAISFCHTDDYSNHTKYKTELNLGRVKISYGAVRFPPKLDESPQPNKES